MGLAYNILTPAKGISKSCHIRKGDAAARLIDILEAKNSVQEVPNAKELNTLSKGIVFDHVHFSYSERTV